MAESTLPEETRELVHRVRTFVEEEVLPVEDEALADEEPDYGVVDALRKEARRRNLWLPHLPEAWGGLGLGPVALAHVHQELGASPLGPLALNCMAPDEGNMHVLLSFGTAEQKERFLRPLAEGQVRSCFAMTEPEVAGSDPSTLRTRAERDGDEWVIDGHKWFTTGAGGAAFSIVVAQTDAEAHRYEGYTLFLVETDREGWELVRDVPVMGGHAPGGHAEVQLTDLRVPEENVLGEVGKGLAHAQDRLGMGRVTHAMRWIGVAQRSLDMTVERAREREAFGRPLAKHGAVQGMLADSAQDLYLSRLAVLEAARRIEEGREHRFEVSMAKVFVANALHRVLDRAIQVHGALGYSKDLPLERFYRDARAARIYDGPDEVHEGFMARRLLKAYEREGSTRRLTGGLP